MPRYFLNNIYYFVTVPTLNRRPFFIHKEPKQFLLNKLKEILNKFEITDYDFAIMNNHYHFIGYFQQGNLIPQILKKVNGPSAIFTNKYLDRSSGIWGDYHIYIASTEQIYERIRGYVIGNPLKHKEVNSLSSLEQYPFSSFMKLVNEFGREYVEELVNSVISMDEDQYFNFTTGMNSLRREQDGNHVPNHRRYGAGKFPEKETRRE
ncbi:MAG: transposase [Candidatus Uhrbacteria bacterium]